MFVNKITVKDHTYRIEDRLEFINKESIGGYEGILELKIGDQVIIVNIKTDDQQKHNKDYALFGIKMANGRKFDGWHMLDGMVSNHSGYYIETRHIINNFKLINRKVTINETFYFRQKNLKNMDCKIISPMPGNKESIVEFEKDIGGCGADGLGKAGHCLVIPNKILLSVKKQNKSKQKSKSKKKTFTDDF